MASNEGGGTLWALDQLRASLQSAAAMCQPSAVFRSVEEEGSFDSADLEEIDDHEGVGVDERAGQLDPADFLLEDEEWFASARWLLTRDETREFVARALKSHLAPIYVPYAAISAHSPEDIVPHNTQQDIETFADDFVLDLNMWSMSVQDVKDALGQALGDKGSLFVPQELPVYDAGIELDDSTQESLAETSALGPFATKFEDSENGWSNWYAIFDEEIEDIDDEEEQDEVEDEADSQGSVEHEVPAESPTPVQSVCQTAERMEDFTATVSVPAGASGGTKDQGTGMDQAESEVKGAEAKALFREVIIAAMEEAAILAPGQGVPVEVADALSAAEERLRIGKNARNAFLLFRYLACDPLVEGQPVTSARAFQATLRMLKAGPLRSLRILAEDFPPSLVAHAREFATKFADCECEPSKMHKMSSIDDQVASLLVSAQNDSHFGIQASGWCLKFVFEGEALEDNNRRAEAFQQYANELLAGPFAGLKTDGQSWSWDDTRTAANALVMDYAAAHADSFELQHGDSLSSVLKDFRAKLDEAGFALPWYESSRSDEVTPNIAETGDVPTEKPEGKPTTKWKDQELPFLGALPAAPQPGLTAEKSVTQSGATSEVTAASTEEIGRRRREAPPPPPDLSSIPLPVPPSLSDKH